MKKIILCVAMLFILTNVKAEELLLTSNIENVKNKIDVIFTYQIEPLDTNPAGATNEPSTFTLNFNNADINNTTATLTYAIDFSETRYQRPGIYEYKISEIKSSNDICNKSNEEYKIIVLVANDGDSLKINVQSQVVDRDGNKSELVFNHEAKGAIKPTEPGDTTNKTVANLPKTGIFMNILPFIILLVIGLVGVIILNKSKKK